jgi:hypothetical protein
MQLKPGIEQEYEAYVNKNQDPYGQGVVDFAEKWASLMEIAIGEGKTIKEIAKETSHQADTDGITGFMYGCAVSSLAHFWVHGEELSRWHNLDTQIGNEGEKANEKGSTLNPALLVIGVK